MVKPVQAVGGLVFVFAYQLLSPWLYGTPLKPASFVPMIGFPLILVTFIAFRHPVTTKALADRHVAQDRIVEHISEIEDIYELIASFHGRPQFVERLCQRITAHNKEIVNANLVLMNSGYFATWLTTLTISLYTLIGGYLVLHKTLSLGMFLANVRIFTQIGNMYHTIYTIVLEIQNVLPALERITTFINAESELNQRMALSRQRRRITEDTVAELRPKDSDRSNVDIVDAMP